MSERSHEGMREFARERREKPAAEVVERLRGEGYFREGESATLVLPAEGGKDKWVARCDVDALINPPDDPERKKRFPSGDSLYDGFVAAGYRVDVMPDYESNNDKTDRAEYYLYEKDKE